ncbi:MAG: hypothetical protein ACOYYI_01335 [Chloroflexota bacterium]
MDDQFKHLTRRLLAGVKDRSGHLVAHLSDAKSSKINIRPPGFQRPPDAPRDEDLIQWILAREPVFMDWMLTHHGPVPAQLYQQFGVRLSFERMGLRRLAVEFWRSRR